MSLLVSIEFKEAVNRSTVRPQLIEYFERQLEEEREAYENTEANEYNRARVVVMREILVLLKGT